MEKLMGKARDVVRDALRSDKTLNVTLKPNLIFYILLQSFSDASSCVPLAEFTPPCLDLLSAELIIC